MSEADRPRLAARQRAVIADRIYPAMTRLRDFLKTEYLPLARDGVGLSAMKGGARLYEKLIRDTTTVRMSADEIHNLGPERSGADPGRDGKGQDGGRLQGQRWRNSSNICAPTPSIR